VTDAWVVGPGARRGSPTLPWEKSPREDDRCRNDKRILGVCYVAYHIARKDKNLRERLGDSGAERSRISLLQTWRPARK